MTVIACKNGVMAADTSVWHGDVTRGKATKVVRLPDGSLMGAAGWKDIIAPAIEWASAGFPAHARPAEARDEQFDSIILKPDGSLWCMGSNFRQWRSESPIEVVGAHSEFLYGAMLAGASAEEAVRLAIIHCSKAAGEVQVVTL